MGETSFMKNNCLNDQKMILVTGGAGYIGSHVISVLLDEGYGVIVLDDFSASSPLTLKSVAEICGRKLVELSVENITKRLDNQSFQNCLFFASARCSDAFLVNHIFENIELYGVMHFAGLKSVSHSVSHPMQYYKENISETIAILELMDRHDCRNLIFSSSASVYGDDSEPPFSEVSQVAPPNPYARTKLIIEQICEDIAATDISWNIKSLRYFNPVGSHETLRIGERLELSPPNLMPVLMKASLMAEPSVMIFGSDYTTPDGTAIRDYIHVMDLAEGHVCALEHNSCGLEIFNLGTGKGYSVDEMVTAFSKVASVQFRRDYQPRRPGDSAISIADVTKAKVILGWTAKRDIEKMCYSAYLWAKQLEQENLNAVQN